MASAFLFDLSSIDLNKVIIPMEEIRKAIPHRFEMEMLSGIVYDRPDLVIGFKDVRTDDFWVRGHIPGRPLMPGVMMIECAAQLCAFKTMSQNPHKGFVGFAKCDGVRFRGTVVPPARLYMIAKVMESNPRQAVASCQGILDGTLVFEAVVTGMRV